MKCRKRIRPLVTVFVLVALGAAGCGGGGSGGTEDPPVLEVGDGLVPAASVDHELRRRAHQHLEAMRDSEMAPTWKEVRLAPNARELFRPDVEGVAYYEFPVIPANEAVGPSCGHIILSTGAHDFPVPHWNFEGLSICNLLVERAAEKGEKAVRFYKLDALSYAAENELGERVATFGTELARVEGMDPAWLDQESDPHVTEWVPDTVTKEDDEIAGGIDGKQNVTGPQPPLELVLGGWDSWDELKNGYRSAYGVLAEDLRRIAEPEWEIEKLAKQNGEGLYKGEIYRLSLLQEKAPPYTITGDGASPNFLQVVLEENPGLPAVLVLTVLESVTQMDLLISVEIEYEALTEIKEFYIVGPAMTGNDPEKPGGSEKISEGRPSGPPRSAWGPWNFFWAGTTNDQRLYEQIAPGTAPNTASCNSGCGGTAWAMLFGWADKQADLGNVYWRPRWGLYRTNGGTGANAVAPRTQDGGVRNMTWEIRNDIGTWCAFSSGPTFPWDMGNASTYFRNRTGTRLESRCNVFGRHKDDLRNSARDSIINNGTPAVIGTGWLNHYPLAYGYAFQVRRTRSCFLWECWTNTEVNRAFYVNQGWGGRENGWVSAGTYLYGSIRP